MSQFFETDNTQQTSCIGVAPYMNNMQSGVYYNPQQATDNHAMMMSHQVMHYQDPRSGAMYVNPTNVAQYQTAVAQTSPTMHAQSNYQVPVNSAYSTAVGGDVSMTLVYEPGYYYYQQATGPTAVAQVQQEANVPSPMSVCSKSHSFPGTTDDIIHSIQNFTIGKSGSNSLLSSASANAATAPGSPLKKPEEVQSSAASCTSVRSERSLSPMLSSGSSGSSVCSETLSPLRLTQRQPFFSGEKPSTVGLTEETMANCPRLESNRTDEDKAMSAKWTKKRRGGYNITMDYSKTLKTCVPIIAALEPFCNAQKEQAAAQSLNIRSCDGCGKIVPRTMCKRCSRCKTATYCNARCQIMHWGSHKKLCNWRVVGAEERPQRLAPTNFTQTQAPVNVSGNGQCA